MSRYHWPAIVFLLIAVGGSFQYREWAFSVIPGWHTPIVPPVFYLGLGVQAVSLLAAVGYWWLAKRTRKIHWGWFLAHLVFTIPAGFYTYFTDIFWEITQTSPAEARQQALAITRLFVGMGLALGLGQVLFFTYWVKAWRGQPFVIQPRSRCTSRGPAKILPSRASRAAEMPSWATLRRQWPRAAAGWPPK
jgi:hypothetical protein